MLVLVVMRLMMILKIREVFLAMKNKNLVVNMQHVKFNAIPPLKGTRLTGVECSIKTSYNNKELGEYKWQI